MTVLDLVAERQPGVNLEGFMAAYTQAWNAGDLDGVVLDAPAGVELRP